VKAHSELGEAYLNYQCYEQAVEHLNVALKKNEKLSTEENQEYREIYYDFIISKRLGKYFSWFYNT